MEQSALPLPRFPKIERITVIVGQPLQILLALLCVMSTATLATILFSRLIGQEPTVDPFLAYASLFPGQPWGSVLAHEFLCYQSVMPSPADLSEGCDYHPETGQISQVYVTTWDGFITRASFTIRDNGLRVGDLALLWGEPELVSFGSGVESFRWPDRGIVALMLPQNGQDTYFSPVVQVNFLRKTSF
jgi:hypothetical protein